MLDLDTSISAINISSAQSIVEKIVGKGLGKTYIHVYPRHKLRKGIVLVDEPLFHFVGAVPTDLFHTTVSHRRTALNKR